jgi:hypothetical protein
MAELETFPEKNQGSVSLESLDQETQERFDYAARAFDNAYRAEMVVIAQQAFDNAYSYAEALSDTTKQIEAKAKVQELEEKLKDLKKRTGK